MNIGHTMLDSHNSYCVTQHIEEELKQFVKRAEGGVGVSSRPITLPVPLRF